MIIRDAIRKLAVRIELNQSNQDENDRLGSGVLWFPDDNTGYCYVFTAAHVVYNKEDLIIRYLDEEGRDLTASIDNNDIAIHSKFVQAEHGKKCINDVAVIRCKSLNCTGLHYELAKLSQITSHSLIIFRGFPNVMHGTSFVLSGKCMEGTYEDADLIRNEFNYSLSGDTSVNQTDRNEELIGCSGSGVFLNYDDNIVLLGIHSSGAGIDSAVNTLSGTTSELIVEICKERDWDTPSFISDIEGDLSDCIEYFLDEIENNDLCNIMDDLILEDFTNVIQYGFCGCSEECEQIHSPHKCKTFRSNLLILVCILKYLGVKTDFINPTIEKEDRHYPIKYVCSEGKNVKSRVAMKHFIHSIKSDYLIKNKVDNGSLIVWGSQNDTRGELTCTTEGFKNILNDIRNDIRREKGFNIKKGIAQPEELSIIHINKIKESIDKNSLEDMKNLVINSIYK